MSTATEKPVNNVDLLGHNPDPTLVAMLDRASKLRDERDTLEVALSECKSQLDTCEASIVEQFMLDGVTKVSRNGRTFFLQDQFFVNKKADRDGVTMGVVCEALNAAGYGYLVSTEPNYNASSLKAAVKELVKGGDALPAELAAVLNVVETTKLAVRKV